MVTTPGFVAEAIRVKREAAGISARSLSLKVGLSPAYVHKLEAGLLEPGLVAFARLALELGMTPGEVWVCVVLDGLRTSIDSTIATSSPTM